jgi:hypothetical protein
MTGVVRREWVFMGAVLALGLAVPAAAQQRPMTDAEQQEQRYQLRTFEAVLQAAVRHGGDEFARQQAQFIPDGVQLTANDAQAHGFVPPLAGGLVFYVAVPTIRPTLNEVIVRWPRAIRPTSTQATADGGRDERVSPAGVPTLAQADPMSVSPVVDDGRCATRVKQPAEYPNPNYDYAVAVCDALMDAILEGSGPLRLKENEWLTIAAANGDPDTTPLLNSPTGYTTYLTIKGTDLLAYRQGRISKDDARKLVDLIQR